MFGDRMEIRGGRRRDHQVGESGTRRTWLLSLRIVEKQPTTKMTFFSSLQPTRRETPSGKLRSKRRCHGVYLQQCSLLVKIQAEDQG